MLSKQYLLFFAAAFASVGLATVIYAVANLIRDDLRCTDDRMAAGLNMIANQWVAPPNFQRLGMTEEQFFSRAADCGLVVKEESGAWKMTTAGRLLAVGPDDACRPGAWSDREPAPEGWVEACATTFHGPHP